MPAIDGEVVVDELLRTTALLDRHRAAGAKLAPFAGWLLPMRYGGVLAEHTAVRTGVGVFDVSHLGTVWVSGPGAAATVAATFTNDPGRLDDGEAQYTLCCDETGGIVDDLIVTRLVADRWLVAPNAANTHAVVTALNEHAIDEVEIADETAIHAVIAVQGPDAPTVLDAALRQAGIDARAWDELAAFQVVEIDRVGRVANGIPAEQAHRRGIIARTGYTGEAGCELILPAAWAEATWDALVAAGATRCGLEARDTLRLEMGYPLYGNELSRSCSPYEANLGWAVKLDRGPFRGSEALRRASGTAPSRRLWGLLGEGRRPFRAGSVVVDARRQRIGELTSGSVSPTLQRPVALGYLDARWAPGDAVEVDLRGHRVPARVVQPPFILR